MARTKRARPIKRSRLSDLEAALPGAMSNPWLPIAPTCALAASLISCRRGLGWDGG